MTPAQLVGEFLQSPDDLMKLAAFRNKLEKEKSSIDAKLKSGVKDQLEATREGLRKLLSTKSQVQSIKDELQNVEVMFKDPANNVKTFDQISRVHRSSTLQLSEQLAHPFASSHGIGFNGAPQFRPYRGGREQSYGDVFST